MWGIAARMAVRALGKRKRFVKSIGRRKSRRRVGRNPRSRLRLNRRPRLRTRSRYGRSRRVRRVKAYDTGDGSYHQLDYLPTVYRKLGRFTRKKINFLVNRNIIYRFQGIKQLGKSGVIGQIPLEYFDNGTHTALPLHLYDLTSVVNINAGTVLTPNAGYVLRFEDANGSVSFAAITGQDNSGAGSTLLQEEYNPRSAHAHERSVLKWVQVKLNLHGCVTVPTKFEITLCQINDLVQSTTIGGPSSGLDLGVQTFWQSLVRNLIHCQIDTQQYPETRRSLKVMKRFTYTMQPTSTDESDTNPHQKVVNLFFRMNRRLRFDWMQTQKTLVTPANLLANGFEPYNRENRVMPDPKARVFLMIRAINTTRVTASPTNSNTTPSYDIILRMNHAINN